MSSKTPKPKKKISHNTKKKGETPLVVDQLPEQTQPEPQMPPKTDDKPFHNNVRDGWKTKF